jgi:hypothetical protein
MNERLENLTAFVRDQNIVQGNIIGGIAAKSLHGIVYST